MNISNPTKEKVEGFLNDIFNKTDIILNGPDNKSWTIAEAYSKDKKDQYGQLDLGVKEKKISGIDIPILLGDGNSYEKKPIVAIVAQDPYRNEKDVLFNEIDKSKTSSKKMRVIFYFASVTLSLLSTFSLTTFVDDFLLLL